MKRIFVSDVHMGAGRSFQPGYKGYVYDWFDKKGASALAECLSYFKNSPDVGEVILLGDIMDNWVCPVDVVPPTFDEVVAAEVNKEAVRALKELSVAKKTIYIPGNHDMSVTAEFLKANLGNVIVQTEYDEDGIFALHGSEYSIFCAADPVNDTESHLPIGYYISRVAATDKARNNNNHHLRDFIEALKDFVSDPFVLAVFDAAKDAAHLANDTSIAMPNGNISVEDVKKRFVNLYKQWDKSDNLIPVNAACLDEINELWSAVSELNSQERHEIIILGHTHKEFLRKYIPDGAINDTFIYANTGAWCYGGNSTFVETEKSDKDGRQYVRLKTWDLKKHRPAKTFQEEFME